MNTHYIDKNSAKLSNNLSKEILTPKSGQQEEKFELISALNDQNIKQNLLKLIRMVDFEKDDKNNYINDLQTSHFNTFDNDNASISSLLHSKKSHFISYNNDSKFQSDNLLKANNQCRSNSPINSNHSKIKETNTQRQRSQSPYQPSLRPQQYTNRIIPKPDKPSIILRPGDVYQKLYKNSISPKFRDTPSPIHATLKIISQNDCSTSRNFSSREIYQTTRSIKSLNSQLRENNLNKTTIAMQKSSSYNKGFDIETNSKIIKVSKTQKFEKISSTKISTNSFYQNSRKSPLLQSKAILRQNESVGKFNKSFNSGISPERQIPIKIPKESSRHENKSQHNKEQYPPYNIGKKLSSSNLKKNNQVHNNYHDSKILDSKNEHSFTKPKQYNLKENLNNLTINRNGNGNNTKILNNLEKNCKHHNNNSTKVILKLYLKLI